MKKYLVIGPSWVGDMVMAQTVFIALKAQDPNHEIDVLAPNWSGPLLERMPEVQRLHNMPIQHGEFGLRKRFEIAQQLKQYHYDAAIVLPHSWKSALIPWFAKIPIRTGFKGECRFGLLNDLRFLNKEKMPKLIERFISLAYEKNQFQKDNCEQPIFTPRLKVNTSAIQKTLEKFEIVIENNKPILALCPGAEFGPSKRWPAEYFAKVGSEKIKAGWDVWLFGSKNDMPVSNEIQRLMNGKGIDFTGKTALGEAIDLLSQSSLVLTNDSGLMHIAAALAKPVIAVYGSTDPKFTPPLTNQLSIERLNVSCSPCFKRVCPLEHNRCMKDLQPEQILTSIEAMAKQCAF